jgi:hypothetical protein
MKRIANSGSLSEFANATRVFRTSAEFVEAIHHRRIQCAEDYRRHWENSEVFPFESVAVAVIQRRGSTVIGTVTLNLLFPLRSVVIFAEQCFALTKSRRIAFPAAKELQEERCARRAIKCAFNDRAANRSR